MNNSATTRAITKIALEYNGNDKGTAEMVASNCLLSETAEGQFHEMKTVAERNSKVKKWALTGYISQPDEIGRKLSDEELRKIVIEALTKVGVTGKNQYRLDIHNSTKHKHIHFVVNRIDISGKCTVKSHNIGKRFGEAVREVCNEKGLLTDIEIGMQKKAHMLENLIEAIRSEDNFADIISKMKQKGFEVQLSSNAKDGISGMRIMMTKDINHETLRQYKAGYKLSEISGQLKISEIKNIFELKQAVKEAQKYAGNLNCFRENLQKAGYTVKIQYKGEFKAGQRNEIQDLWINKIDNNQQKNGFFFRKNIGFSFSAIDSNLADWVRSINQSNTIYDAGNHLNLTANESMIEIANKLLDDLLNPTYVSRADEEFWKKKRKLKR
ncbi:relaxase/mobilization nuclease domain-containing protein [Chryseobacterium gambrini]|uniref:relaxase/mobilization nuclease domain-containing protein n=1 Tax=Chryseobacterium gambrini TaxID=373672 RepID=UPI0022F18393|nr:relaxase/mobilization nuclease domain-containing protein [Chryseobacterium gambrini]WBV54138.1 relaxase/mobilization nuclease domain-containing protein [Chryseobacterium gambrini]